MPDAGEIYTCKWKLVPAAGIRLGVWAPQPAVLAAGVSQGPQ